MSSKEKSRDISVFQLFEILQLEYICCEIRAKIYPLQKDKNYWILTAERKKEKILDISKRNFLPNIFDDKKIKIDFEKKIYNEIGMPNFIYKDEEHRLQQEKWDINNYFMLGKDVKVYHDQKIQAATILSFNFQTDEVKVKLKDTDKTYIFTSSTVTRVL